MISFGVFETFGVGLLILGFGYLLSKLRIFSVLCLPAAVLGGVFALSVLVLFSYYLSFLPNSSFCAFCIITLFINFLQHIFKI